MPSSRGVTPTVVKLALEADKFELKLYLKHFMVQEYSSGYHMEDHNAHIHNFLETCDAIKLNEVSNDVAHLELFPFSCEDKAKS